MPSARSGEIISLALPFSHGLCKEVFSIISPILSYMNNVAIGSMCKINKIIIILFVCIVIILLPDSNS